MAVEREGERKRERGGEGEREREGERSGFSAKADKRRKLAIEQTLR